MVAKYKRIGQSVAISVVVLSALSALALAEHPGDGGGNSGQTNPLHDERAAITPKELLRKCAEYLESMPPYAMHTDTRAQYSAGKGQNAAYEQRWDGVRIDVAYKWYSVEGNRETGGYDSRSIWTGKQFQHRQQSLRPG